MHPPKSRVPANIPDGSSHHSPGEHPMVPVSPGLLTDPPTRATSTPQPPVPGSPWSRTIRDRWKRIRPRKSRVPADLPDSSAPIPLHERPDAPASPGLPTDPQARPDGDADARGNAQTSSRTQPSRNQSEVSPPIAANVALGKAYDRMAAAPPRDRNERRRWKARQRRRAARNRNMDSDSDSESEPEDNDAESYYEDTGCLDAFCFLECCRWWRHRRSQ
ncbi:hypothetical protein BV22DRAFT_596340 [Leucogyrophana mollusca]|uniref:Uncharacterized protein n=1 Tax=Leucogyrophana mollusca TaxID=85980 RepID=A0ACB8BBW5_9AGAM|nr:hypothetical protein BV22DRAFT_596340 [Leucogyrophana mollusca]